jgi:hypothetical protein
VRSGVVEPQTLADCGANPTVFAAVDFEPREIPSVWRMHVRFIVNTGRRGV